MGQCREINYLLYTFILRLDRRIQFLFLIGFTWILRSSRRMTGRSVTRVWVSKMTRVLWVIHGVDWRCASGAAEVNDNVSGLPG